VTAPVNTQCPNPSYTSILMRYFVLLLSFALLFGCNFPTTTTHSGSDRSVEQQKAIADPVASSQFSVNVQLSGAARAKLTNSKETIVVAGYFTGHPKAGTEARYLDIKSGEVTLGGVRQEIRPGETAVFNQLNLSSDAVSRIDSQGPHILINVFSGRRSSKNNLLACTLYDGALESLRGKTIVIRCQLIEEQFPQSSR
jgi:hypothetical protein